LDSRTVLINTLEELAGFKGHESPAIATPWPDLNKIILGFYPGELTIIAARPGAGKTSMAINIAENLTMDKKIPALFFSIEMKPTQLQSRIICSRLKISLHKIRDGSLATGDWVRIADIENDIAEAPLIFDGSTKLTINEIRSKSRRALKRYGIKIVFVDYIQKITGPKSETREREMSFISGQLKETARELNIPVVALCQLSRAIEQRGDDSVPKLSDLRESGAIEQDADVVMFLYSKFDKNKKTFDPVTTVLVLKQRHGPPGHCQLHFDKRITKFKPESPRKDENG
jgi:replicative DNA helicase